MKRLNIRTAIVLMLCTTIITGCKKDGEVFGVPAISRVATVADKNADLKEGALNQWLVIWGSNLKTAESVVFNDLVVERKNIHSNDSTVSVQIPRSMPGTSTNLITIKTKGGVATYSFKIAIPPLVVTGIRNEYTPVGDSLEIYGDNFDLYDIKNGSVVTFTGGKTAVVVAASATSLKIIVPTAPGAGPLKIKGMAPLNKEATTNAWYLDNRNMIISLPFTGWNGSFVNSDVNFPGNPGPMIIANSPYNGNWDWGPFMSTGISFPAAADGANAVNYVMKFEINTKVPIKAGGILFRMGDNNLDYRWKPQQEMGRPLDTKGQWITYTIPLGSILKTKPTDHGYFELVNNDSEASANNFAAANFRIVPK